jgi:hypothetical protein
VDPAVVRGNVSIVVVDAVVRILHLLPVGTGPVPGVHHHRTIITIVTDAATGIDRRVLRGIGDDTVTMMTIGIGVDRIETDTVLHLTCEGGLRRRLHDEVEDMVTIRRHRLTTTMVPIAAVEEDGMDHHRTFVTDMVLHIHIHHRIIVIMIDLVVIVHHHHHRDDARGVAMKVHPVSVY